MWVLDISASSEKRKQTLDIGRNNSSSFSGQEASGDSFHLLSWQTGAILGLFFLSRPLSFVFVLLSCFVSFYFFCLLHSVLHFLYFILYFGYHIYNFQRFFFCIVSFHTIFFFLWMQYFLLPLKDIDYSYFDLSFLQALFLLTYFVAIVNVGEFQLSGYIVLVTLKNDTPNLISSSVLGDWKASLEGDRVNSWPFSNFQCKC